MSVPAEPQAMHMAYLPWATPFTMMVRSLVKVTAISGESKRSRNSLPTSGWTYAW